MGFAMYLFDALQTSPALLAAIAVLFGLLVGSFLNVVVHRLPIMLAREWRSQAAEVLQDWAQDERAPETVRKSGNAVADVAKTITAQPRYNLVVPRSACPSCSRQITALQNIPIVSWLWLRGRCSGCGAPIRPRYPLVEALTGVISGYVAWRFGFSIATLGALLFCWALIAATFIDFDTQLLPDDITLPLLWAGLLFNLGGVFTPLSEAVIGAVAGYLSLWTVYWAFKLATGKDGMGFGDFKLLAAIGAWLGWKMLPAVILLSSLVGAVVGIILIVLARHGRQVPIPFGPYLAAAGMIALFWGESINRFYLNNL
jgi:leader peptidase (prepilin peptidase)/N-methyltransferase